ncbi:MAG: N-acetylmuramoyl-L-alanine amidase [Prevotellaceae bacterium]|jgi:N-acetylmuramoyl-L-alanine amidase|nr:N-acetylmuramoyl-L-alanine amidase [Prevotellaceae bacterium]
MNQIKTITIAFLTCLSYTLLTGTSIAQAAESAPFVVVLDAGHGGHDPGAVGAFSQEKKINLAIVLAVGQLIEENQKDMRVVYTRKTDRYLTLQERADIANKAHADLFVSVHTNANNSPEANGTETYTLGVTKAKSNLEVAMRENSVILLEDDYKQKYEGFNPRSDDSYIMFECIQNTFQGKSVEIAQDIQKNFVAANRKDRSVRQAGFWVLHKTAMPSVLVELGYISNRDEERYLNTDEGQKALANALYNALVKFKNEHLRKSGKQNYVTADAFENSKNENNKADTLSTPKRSHDERLVAVQEKIDSLSEVIERKKSELKTEPVSSSAEKLNPSPTESRKATAQKDKIIFKLQIMALSKKLPATSPEFKGLKVDYFVEGELYKYTHGESADYFIIQRLRKQLIDKFPDALIVAFRNGKKIPVTDAVKATMK